MLRIRVARYANADASECGKEKASSPHKPHAVQEAFWIVGVLYKSKHGKHHRKRPQNRRDPPALLPSCFYLHVQQVYKLYSMEQIITMELEME